MPFVLQDMSLMMRWAYQHVRHQAPRNTREHWSYEQAKQKGVPRTVGVDTCFITAVRAWISGAAPRTRGVHSSQANKSHEGRIEAAE